MNYEFTLEINDKEYDVVLAIELGSDSIGGYEFWGQKCFDAGNTCIEGYDIVSVTGDDGPVEITSEIEAAIDADIDFDNQL